MATAAFRRGFQNHRWERAVFLPRAAAFHVLAETANGNVSNHFARQEETGFPRATRVNMSIGPEPSPEVTIRATNGDIEIAAAQT